MQILRPAIAHALDTHAFADNGAGRRTCSTCGLTVPTANNPATLLLVRVPVCMDAPAKAAQDGDDADD